MTTKLVSRWDNNTIVQPYETDVVPSWDERETHNQKQCIALLMEVERDANKIWVIRMNLKGPVGPDGKYRHRHYPMFFPTEEHARIYYSLAPQFREWPEDVRSVSFESIRFPKPERPSLKARSRKFGESYGKT